jgi:hypothetical protein
MILYFLQVSLIIDDAFLALKTTDKTGHLSQL